MNKTPDKSKGCPVEGRWKGLGVLERLKIILDYRNLFLALGMITQRELRKVLATSEGGREYVAERDGHKMFCGIDLSSDSIVCERLRGALGAVFEDMEYAV